MKSAVVKTLLFALAVSNFVAAKDEDKKWVVVSSTNVENDNDAHTFAPMKKIKGGESYASVDAITPLSRSDIHNGLTVDKIENIDKDFPIEVKDPVNHDQSDELSFEADDIESAISADTDLMAKLEEQLEAAQAKKEELQKDAEVLKVKLELKKLSKQARENLTAFKNSKDQVVGLKEQIESNKKAKIEIQEKLERELAEKDKQIESATGMLKKKYSSIKEIKDVLEGLHSEIKEFKIVLQELMDGEIKTVDIAEIEAYALGDASEVEDTTAPKEIETITPDIINEELEAALSDDGFDDLSSFKSLSSATGTPVETPPETEPLAPVLPPVESPVESPIAPVTPAVPPATSNVPEDTMDFKRLQSRVMRGDALRGRFA